jgi:6-phospho-beta-glucosidase
VKVAVVGGGSTYTPELVQGLADRGAALGVEELVLQDIDAERLAVVGSFARRILARRGWPGHLALTGDLEAALEGASFCLVQLRVGGQAARLRDETIPHRFGILGQETTGPGGFAKALRTVPVVLDVAERYASRAAPGGWFIDFTNPVGIVTQALIDAGHRALGLCNAAIGLQREIASALGIDAARVELESVGLNHASWFREVRVDGRPCLADLLRDHADRIAEETGWSRDAVVAAGAIPSYYQSFYDHPDRILAEQLAEGTRASEVIEIERGLLELYRDPTLDEKPALLSERGGAWYSEAALELMEALGSPEGRHLVVDVRNDGALPDLPSDLVVEVTSQVDRTGARPLAGAPLGEAKRSLVLALDRYQRLTIRAARSGDRDVALDALAANPLVPSREVAGPLLEAILDANRDLLPRFFPESRP